MLTIEIIGFVAAVLAVVGVVFNNHKRIACFYIWLASNLFCFAVHAAAGLQGVDGMWPLAVRDIVFFGLAIHGLRVWSGKAEADAAKTRSQLAAIDVRRNIFSALNKKLKTADVAIENLGDMINVKDIEITQLKAKLKQEIKYENNEKT